MVEVGERFDVFETAVIVVFKIGMNSGNVHSFQSGFRKFQLLVLTSNRKFLPERKFVNIDVLNSVRDEFSKLFPGVPVFALFGGTNCEETLSGNVFGDSSGLP